MILLDTGKWLLENTSDVKNTTIIGIFVVLNAHDTFKMPLSLLLNYSMFVERIIYENYRI
jgi:hypothetical protein